MTLTRHWRNVTPPVMRLLACLLLCIVAMQAAPAARAQAPQPQGRLLLPTVTNSAIPASEKLCRLGIGGTSAIAAYPIRPLRLGWYLDWTATQNPAQPDGIAYHPMIRLSQIGLDGYKSEPRADQLPQIVADRPGAMWFIGNEPDRRYYQDSIEPHVYARAYHDLYAVIKQADPTAQVAIGAIVQPTPLRLQYLDMVLQAYERFYGRPNPGEPAMPVDVWNIHAFILRERSSQLPDSWGADIPPGIDVLEGMLYEIDDHDSLVIFKNFIETFRQWMSDRGYQDRPLIITEFGILWPEDYGSGFGPARVNAFMSETFAYLGSATGLNGYPADNNRLVQSWAWYSLTDGYNGMLFDPIARQRTVFGNHFAALAAKIPGDANLRPVRASATREAAGHVTLSVTVANNGNSAIPGVFGVKFYRGNPLQGGMLVGAERFVHVLEGCGTTSTVTVEWPGAPGSQVDLWVVVDPGNLVAERDEADNTLALTLPAE